jgi:hypothetical protein
MSDSNPNQGKKPVVRVQRRRPAGSTGSESRERAEAPQREGREDQQVSTPTPRSSSYQQPSSGSSQTGLPTSISLPSLSGKSIWLLLGVLVVGCICVGAYMLFFRGGGDGGDNLPVIVEQPTLIQEIATEAPTSKPAATRKPFIAPTRSSDQDQNWLVMLYEDADDKILEQDIYVDLNEAERVGSSDNVKIVAQIDRYSGGYTGDGNWTSTKRYYVTKDDDLQAVNSELVADLGEQNMADGNTLTDFVAWAVEAFPSDKYVLILSDHGMGWPGGLSDPSPSVSGDSSTPLSSRLGNQMYLMNLDATLQSIRDQVGLDKFELIGLDACLMSQLEVLTAMAPHARYAVASEETEPALGWAYSSFLQSLEQDPGMSGAELGKLIVDSYIQDDQRIVDDQARAEMLGRGSPMGGLFGFGAPSANQIASEIGKNVTLAVIDLSAITPLVDRLNELAFILQEASQQDVAKARTYAQGFTSIFGDEVPRSYIDLGNFVKLLKETGLSAEVEQAADNLLAALEQAVITGKYGPGKPGATGMSIYFPNSQLFESPVAGPESYTGIASRFAGSSVWDDFLVFHYTGRAFEAAERRAVVPESSTPVSAPGLGKITLSPITLSDTVAAPGQPVLLSTDISGTNIGYIYLFVGYLDQQSNSIFVADMDYLDSSDTRQVDGVYYPVWPAEDFTLEFEWEPLMFAISDGTDSVTALLKPQDYGASPEEATYTVDGIYNYASGESRNARLYFRNGQLRQVFGFTGDGATGAPREIYPSTGDTFTIIENWMDMDAQGNVVKQSTEEGGTLTFSDQMFTYKELDAAIGEYIVGFIAEDLDGNGYQVYTSVTVE